MCNMGPPLAAEGMRHTCPSTEGRKAPRFRAQAFALLLQEHILPLKGVPKLILLPPFDLGVKPAGLEDLSWCLEHGENDRSARHGAVDATGFAGGRGGTCMRIGDDEHQKEGTQLGL